MVGRELAIHFRIEQRVSSRQEIGQRANHGPGRAIATIPHNMQRGRIAGQRRERGGVGLHNIERARCLRRVCFGAQR